MSLRGILTVANQLWVSGIPLDKLASDDVLDTAYAWLCKRRGGWPPDADVWSFRHRWRQEKAMIRAVMRDALGPRAAGREKPAGWRAPLDRVSSLLRRFHAAVTAQLPRLLVKPGPLASKVT